VAETPSAHSITEPPNRRGVGGIAVLFGAPFRAPPRGRHQRRAIALLSGVSASVVTPMDELDDLLGAHLGEQLPQWLRSNFAPNSQSALTMAEVAKCMTPFPVRANGAACRDRYRANSPALR